MPDSSDQETRKSDRPPPTPAEGDTLDAPAPLEPGTLSALTHSGSDAEPLTATTPRVGVRAGEPFPDPPGFVIVREVGSGGMGVVYEARQAQLNRAVALKVLKGGRGDTNAVIRFLAEAQAVAAITHPHVVQVYGSGQADAGPYMVLELLTGGTLSDKLREGRMAPRAAADLLAKLAGAVQAAHDLGIVHRDLKPSNVLFDSAGEPKVTDFGLAKKTGGTDLTHTNALMGTPAYMAPEQARGETKFVGPLADVWALGAILYECLTGKRAFDADDTWGTLRKVTDEAPPAPRAHVPDLPRDLELIALKCLEKTPADRYPSAAALAADLENYLAGRPVTVRPAGSVERLTKWAKRNPTVAALTASVALALVIGSAVSLAFGLQAQRRGEQLAGANADLTRSNDDLKTARDEQTALAGGLKVARDDLATKAADLAALAGGLKVARDDLATKAADLAAANEAAAERGYLSDVALAHQLWKANDLRGMRTALARCPPERRRWEWHHLDRLSRPERDVLATDSIPLALAYSPDGKRLAHLTIGGTLTVRDLATGGSSSHTVDSPQGTNRALAFHPDGTELAFSVGNRYWTVALVPWTVKEITPKDENGKLLSAQSVLALGYAKNGQLVLAEAVYPGIGQEWVFRIRDASAGKTVATLKSGVNSPRVISLDVGGAAFSADATRFAATLVDSGIRVGFPGQIDKDEPFRPVVRAWEVGTGKLLVGTEGGTRFGDLAFRPNSTAVAFGTAVLAKVVECRNEKVKIGDDEVTFRGTHWVYHGNTDDVLTVVPDATGLVWSGGKDKLIRAHSALEESQRVVLRGCASHIFRIAVSPNGKEVAAATGDLLGGAGAVHRFDVAALEADVWRSSAGRNRLSTVNALSPDGTTFAALDFSLGGEKQPEPTFLIRGVGDGAERKVESGTKWPRVALRPNGGVVLLEDNQRIERKEWLRFLAPDGKPEGRVDLPLGDRLDPRSVLAATRDGKTVAVVSPIRLPAPATERRPVGARLATWDAATRAPGKTCESNVSQAVPPLVTTDALYPTAAAFDATGQKLAAVFTLVWNKDRGGVEYRGAVLVWDVTTGAELFRQSTPDPMRAVCFAHDGTLVTAGGSTTGGTVHGWNLATGARAFTMPAHTRPVLTLASGPDGRLATGGADRVVKVWDTASRREILTLDGFARDVTHLAFTADGKNLVAATGIDHFDALTTFGVPTDWTPAEVRVFRGPK
jgi:WD40 repeat protein/tRNA A-37 threonylcarbamoyl transferase component Bud32